MRISYSQRYFNRFLTTMERFEESWEEDKNGCWIWLHSTDRDGYGRPTVNGRPIRAPRLAWELYRGPIPDGLFVLHNCDVPRCVNPEHLRLGTPRDNANDAINRGRHHRQNGEKNSQAKLTEADVVAIRKSLLAESELGRIYGISAARAGEIRRGRGWLHVK